MALYQTQYNSCVGPCLTGPEIGNLSDRNWVYIRFPAGNPFYWPGFWLISGEGYGKSGKLDLFEAGRLFPVTFECNEQFDGACPKSKSNKYMRGDDSAEVGRMIRQSSWGKDAAPIP